MFAFYNKNIYFAMPTSKQKTFNILVWVNIFEEESENIIDNTIVGIFSDVTPFYISEHRKTFSKYCIIIIQFAYK